MGDTLVHSPDHQVEIIRTILRYPDGNIGIQDEIHPDSENEGVQLNFEIDRTGKVIKYPQSEEPSSLGKRCFEEIRTMSTTAGAKMRSRDGFSATSDGTSWVPDTEQGISRSASSTVLDEDRQLTSGK